MAIDVSPASPSGSVALAASDSGGLFETTDGGDSWRHVDSFPTFRLVDVRYAPTDSDVVIVTALADSRTTLRGFTVSMGGIWRSTDGGDTWEKPVSAEPFVKGCPTNGRADAFGIAFGPGNDRVYVGTECGISVSDDLGESWTALNVSGKSRSVSSVTVPKDGIVDVCGAGGHFRLNWTDDGSPSSGDWQGGSLPKACHRNVQRAPQSLAVSPENPNVLFAAVSAKLDRCGTDEDDEPTRTVFQSTDGGQSWTDLEVPCTEPNREPFVTTPPATTDGTYDIYFGDGVDTWRQTDCSSVPPGCTAGSGNWNRVTVEHPDQIDIAYPPETECPKFMANDGGVERTDDCGDSWYNVGKATNGYNALQLYEVEGQLVDSSPPHTDMYIGTQDNGVWASPDGGATWGNRVGSEGGFLSIARQVPNHTAVSDRKGIVGVRCADPCERFRSGPHFENDEPWQGKGNEANGTPQFIEPGVYVEWGEINGTAGWGELWLTEDNGDSWEKLKNLSVAPSGFGLEVSGPPSDPTIYVPVQRGVNRVGLVKLTNVRGPGPVTVSDADNGLRMAVHPMGFAWRRVVSVDPEDPDHLIAADYDNAQVNVSTDGGTSWSRDLELTRYVVNDSEFEPALGGPIRDDTVRFIWGRLDQRCCSQIRPITFHPTDNDRILVGTHANGIIASVDGGETWGRVPGSRQIPLISSFFVDERRGKIYVSSYGRGLWVMDEEDLTPLRQIQGRNPTGPTESLTSIVDPDSEDVGILSNDGFASATALDPSGEHTHIENKEAAESLGWIGEDSEVWGWGIDDQTLHDGSDADFFNLSVPDPEQAQSAHDGFPECTRRERDPDEVPLPDRFTEGGTLVIESRLVAILDEQVPLSGAGVPDDPLRVYDAADRSTIDRYLECPRSEHGVTDVFASYGERPNPDRVVYPEYDFGMTYRSDIQFVPKIAGWLLDEIESESGRAAGVFPCGEGIFPYSCEPQGSFGFHHPQSPVTPDCRADGPGCPMYWGFHWQTEQTLDMSFRSDTDLEYELLHASGQPIARARDEPQLFSLGTGPAPNSRRSTNRFYGVNSPQSELLSATQESGITKRLVVSDLEPGFYVLKVNGTRADVAVEFDPPPQPPDSDGDGISDYFDAEPHQNLPPTVGSVEASPIDRGRGVNVTATFTDPGVLDTHTATIDWGDGTVERVQVTDRGGRGTIAGTHTYSDGGEYEVKVAVTDDDGGTGVRSIRIAVTDAPRLPPIDGFENPPTDPDDDGTFEDVNGDGQVDVGDVQAIFANRQDPVVRDNAAAFDFNDDGGVNVGDVQALFARRVGV